MNIQHLELVGLGSAAAASISALARFVRGMRTDSYDYAETVQQQIAASSQAVLQSSNAQINTYSERVIRLEGRIEELSKQHAVLLQDNAELRGRVNNLTFDNSALRAKVEAQAVEIEGRTVMIEELRARLAAPTSTVTTTTTVGD